MKRSSADPRGVAILGSTGSIGTTALRVLARQSDRFRVAALTAFNNAELLGQQVEQFHPTFVGIVKNGAKPHAGWEVGPECLVDAARRDDVDIVLNAVVGAAGLDATLAALARGKRVALANKETLVMAGSLVGAACAEGGGEIVPVDSEHSAILQCITGRPGVEVRRVIITASGGPFRQWTAEQLERATLEDALRHPTWQMGRKITVDSATLANKALEVIEAHFLFGLPYDRIEVVVHPQSIVHSFVEFVDGSVLAQLGLPSMELPVLYALTHPERVVDSGVPQFDPVACSPLTFEPLPVDRFPAFALGVSAGRQGGVAPAVFNAANEAAVALFLEGRIRFAHIGEAIAGALDAFGAGPGDTREAILAADRAARRHVEERFGC
ncbi:MAG TPA: 1-deoxy-D-xylulose-5-phosphate reductoisomerase [Gemmatimonadaceae bacterium]